MKLKLCKTTGHEKNGSCTPLWNIEVRKDLKKKKDTWLKIFEVRGKTSDCKYAKGQSWVVHYIKFHVETNASTTVAETKI